MKDELHVYCRLEGLDEVYLRAHYETEKKLLRLENKRLKRKKRSSRKSGRLNEEMEES